MYSTVQVLALYVPSTSTVLHWKMRSIVISSLLLSLLFYECIGSVYKIESSSIGSLKCKVLRNTQTGTCTLAMNRSTVNVTGCEGIHFRGKNQRFCVLQFN